ncbi:MAG: chemotaxis protein CheA [Anaerolineae bacterium]|nr:chemotaxis protein CheA [Anaerolineae bacterium]
MENKLTFNIEADELELFIDEVNEYLQVIESSLLQLEEQASSPETLNLIFRAAHTIKALAGTVGHQRMADLTHAMESLFDAMRNHQLTPTQQIVDELFGVVDILKILRDEIINQKASNVDITAVLSQLHKLLDRNSQATSSKKEQVSVKNPLTPEQIAQIKKFQEDEQSILEIEIATDAKTFAPAARLMQAAMALLDAGQVISQSPTMEELSNGKHDNDLVIILATKLKDQAIKELLGDVADLSNFQVRPFEVNAPVTTSVESVVTPPPPPTPVAVPKNNNASASVNNTSKTVRISVERLDALINLVGELVTNRNRLKQVEETLRSEYGKDETVGELSESSTHMGRLIDQLQEEVMRARMLPISHLFDKLPRLVRDVARTSEKQVNLIIEGAATELDRSVIEVIGDPLIHLLRNAVDHGLETPEQRLAANKSDTGTVKLTAAHLEGRVVITVEDDGKGIDPDRVRQSAVKRKLITPERAAQLSNEEAIDLIFQPNLSTAEKLTEVSGRGVGMDVVRTNVERLGGSVFVESVLGQGTVFRVTLPLTLAIIETMLVELWNTVYAIPITGINDVLYFSDTKTDTIGGMPAIRWRGAVLPLINLRQSFSDPRLSDIPKPIGVKQAIVTVTWGKQRCGLIVDRIIGKQGIVVKSLNSIAGEVPGISGCTILGDGRVALIIDIPGLINAELRLRHMKEGLKNGHSL